MKNKKQEMIKNDRYINGIKILECEKTVHVTSDYDMFRTLNGNRITSSANVKRIKKSMIQDGFIEMPIMINRHMEIIDGQHRFEVLKQLGLPIPYILNPKASGKECRILNTNCKNWVTKDYLYYNKSNNSQNAKIIIDLSEKYECNVETVMSCIYGSGRDASIIKYAIADTDITPTMKKDGEYILSLVNSMPFEKNLGTKRTFVRALRFLKSYTDCDMEKLKSKYIKHMQFMKPFNNVKHCLESLEKIYNYKSRNEYMYFTQAFEEAERNEKREARKKYIQNKKD